MRLQRFDRVPLKGKVFVTVWSSEAKNRMETQTVKGKREKKRVAISCNELFWLFTCEICSSLNTFFSKFRFVL